jgi:hypothetical protein
MLRRVAEQTICTVPDLNQELRLRSVESHLVVQRSHRPRPCAGRSPPAGAHSLRIAARQPCGHRLGSEVATPVLRLLSYCSSRTEDAYRSQGPTVPAPPSDVAGTRRACGRP